MLRRLIAPLALAVVASGCGPSAPDRSRMEAMTGTSLETPLRFGGPFDAIRNARRMPIPNQMAPRSDDAPTRYLWVYPLDADSAYRPPASSPLDCEVVPLGASAPTVALQCSAAETDERGRWTYELMVYPEYGSGSFAATLTPE